MVYEYLYRQISDKKVRETIDFLLNREEAHNALFREAFNKVQKTGSNRDFGTTKAAKMYFSLSEPSPMNSSFTDVNSAPPKVIAQQLPKKYDRFAVSGGNGSDGFSAAAVDWSEIFISLTVTSFSSSYENTSYVTSLWVIISSTTLSPSTKAAKRARGRDESLCL